MRTSQGQMRTEQEETKNEIPNNCCAIILKTEIDIIKESQSKIGERADRVEEKFENSIIKLKMDMEK